VKEAIVFDDGVKVKLSRYCHAGAKGEAKYSSYSFLTSSLDGESGQRQASAALYPWERTPWAGL
jgi:hypothetical protein